MLEFQKHVLVSLFGKVWSFDPLQNEKLGIDLGIPEQDGL